MTQPDAARPAARSAEIGIAASRSIPGFTIKEFRQPPHRRLPWHEHVHASICFVVSGSYSERVRDREQECAPRSMIVKPPAEQHADVFGRSGACCLLMEILPGRLETIEPFSELTTRPVVARSARLAALGQRVFGEFSHFDAVSPLALEGLILEVLADVSRTVHNESAASVPRWLRQARELLHERSHEALTLSTVAREVGIHPSHLARTFRKHYGRPIGHYLRALRIERAAREVAESRTPLSEIGLRAGFFDQSHFAKVFKRHTGVTPAQFRARSA